MSEPTITKRFSKLSISKESAVSAEWTTHEDTETHTHKLVCKDPPHPDLVAALDALLVDVVQIIELPIGYLVGMRVQGLTLTLNERTGARGATVCSLKPVSIANGPLVLHTPILIGEPEPEADVTDEDRRGHMPRGMWDRILTVEREGWAYLDGKRAPQAQVDLFEGTDQPGDDADEPEPTATRRRRPREATSTV